MKNSKFTIFSRFFTSAVLTAVALMVAPAANAVDKGCSNATLHGSYAQIGSGVITAPADQAGPFANIGTLFFDGNGNVTGTLVINQNGTTAQATETGTYTVNSDCTGTYTVEINPFGFSSGASFAIASGGDELEIMVTDLGSVITCVAKKLFPGRAT